MVFPGKAQSEQGGGDCRQQRRWWLLGAVALVTIVGVVGAFSLFSWRLRPDRPLPPESEELGQRIGTGAAVLPSVGGTPSVTAAPSVTVAPNAARAPLVAKTKPRVPLFSDPATPPAAAAELIQEADRVLARMIEEFPDVADSFELRARFLKWRGNSAEAVKNWQHCLELDPRYAHAYLGLGRVSAAQGRYIESAEYYQKVLEISAGFPEAQTELARVLIDLGRIDEAVELLEGPNKLSDGQSGVRSPESHFLLGQAYARQQDYATACQHYQTTTRLQPDYADAYYGWATALAQLGRKDEAREAMARFPRVGPTRSAGHPSRASRIRRPGGSR